MQQYILDITPDAQAGGATLRLSDAHGRQLGFNEVRFADHPASRWEGLFDTGGYLARYAGNLTPVGRGQPYTEQELLAELGLFLAQAVLGEQIMGALAGSAHRTLLLRLPQATDPVTAGLARVPWEIARSALDQPPLTNRNLVPRLLLQGSEPQSEATTLDLDQKEELRILLVFAEAPGSRPLAMRQERERLLALFRDEIQSRCQVRVDVLCHGVTRGALRTQVQDAGGYHLLHWSGHGQRDLLELAGPDGGSDRLSGAELVALLDEAGGFYPHLVFLSACHSGALMQARDWGELRAALGLARAPDEDAPAEPDLDAALARDSGYTSTALALLGAGVPQVVAMRHAVGDDYARRLARRFYHHLLGPASQPADSALNQARKELLRHPEARNMGAGDQANPLVLGAERVQIRPAPGRSPQLARLSPRPQPLLSAGRRDLEPRERFVGRGGPLAQLNLEWLQGRRASALVQGLAGLGKTALAAEAVHFWHPRFDWVLCWQSRPEEIRADDFYRDLDLRLTQHSSAYADTCRGQPAARVWLEPGELWSGEARYEKMRANLLQALAAEAVLLVLDNFESNLAEGSTERGHPCKDPEWERLLVAALVEGLPRTRSRLLVTSRHRAAALDREQVLWLPLDPLPVGEAVLFLHRCPALAELIHGDGQELALAQRVLDVSRGHPLILERLCTLAQGREELTQALDTLAEQGGYQHLPELFARGADKAALERERRYLKEIAVGAVDLLLQRQSAQARRLLWVLALAGEPVEQGMLAGVWSGKGLEEEQLEQFRQYLEMVKQLPEAQRPALPELPPEIRAALEAAQDTAPDTVSLLRALHRAGLIHREGGNGPWSCHELVRERALAWMHSHTDETLGRSQEQVWIAYAERYEAQFKELLRSGAANARDHAVAAGRRALGYCVRAGALERLGRFVGDLVTNTHAPRLLDEVVRELRSVVGRVQEGRPRWSLRTYIADGLDNAGRHDEALPFYEEAAAEAEAAGHWSDLGWISQNWASALGDTGQLEEAKRRFLAGAEAKRKAGRPEINILSSELEVLRIEVMQGEARQVQPEIERLLERIRGWWRSAQAREPVPEAPDLEFLGRLMAGALDISRDAALRLDEWEETLELLDEMEEVEQALGTGEHQRARTHVNRYGPLLRLGRLGEAQALLEECLALFRRYDDMTHQAMTLSALSDLWDKKNDPGQAAALQRRALDLRNRLPDPGNRAISHNNLANYLERLGETQDAARHRLAAFCYDLAGGYGYMLRQHVHNLSIAISKASSQGEPYPLPTLEALLAEPEFDPLRRFLVERGIDPGQLQGEIDQILDQLSDSYRALVFWFPRSSVGTQTGPLQRSAMRRRRGVVDCITTLERMN